MARINRANKNFQVKNKKEIKYNSFEEFLRMDVLKKINVKYSVPCINMDNINCNIDEFNKNNNESNNQINNDKNDGTNNNQHVIDLFKCKLRSKKSDFSNINKKTCVSIYNPKTLSDFFISWSDFFRNIESILFFYLILNNKCLFKPKSLNNLIKNENVNKIENINEIDKVIKNKEVSETKINKTYNKIIYDYSKEINSSISNLKNSRLNCTERTFNFKELMGYWKTKAFK